MNNISSKEKIDELYTAFNEYKKQNEEQNINEIKILEKRQAKLENEVEHLLAVLDSGKGTEIILNRIEDKHNEIERIKSDIELLLKSIPEKIEKDDFLKLVNETKIAILNRDVKTLKRFISFYIKVIKIGKDNITVVLSHTKIVLTGGGAGVVIDEHPSFPTVSPSKASSISSSGILSMLKGFLLALMIIVKWSSYR